MLTSLSLKLLTTLVVTSLSQSSDAIGQNLNVVLFYKDYQSSKAYHETNLRNLCSSVANISRQTPADTAQSWCLCTLQRKALHHQDRYSELCGRMRQKRKKRRSFIPRITNLTKLNVWRGESSTLKTTFYNSSEEDTRKKLFVHNWSFYGASNKTVIQKRQHEWSRMISREQY